MVPERRIRKAGAVMCQGKHLFFDTHNLPLVYTEVLPVELLDGALSC